MRCFDGCKTPEEAVPVALGLHWLAGACGYQAPTKSALLAQVPFGGTDLGTFTR